MPVALAPGAVSLFDRRYGMHGYATDHRAISCMIPRERLDTRPFDRAPALMWSCNAPEGRLLGNALQTLWADLPRARAEAAKGLAAGVTGLINGLLSARPDDEARRSINQATLSAMQAFIKRHLHDRNLDAAILCRTFACLRARLYRLFRPYGGVERYVRDQRLQRCFDELGRADPTRGRIRAVAAKWGSRTRATFIACSRHASASRRPRCRRWCPIPTPDRTRRGCSASAPRSRSCIAGSANSSNGFRKAASWVCPEVAARSR